VETDALTEEVESFAEFVVSLVEDAVRCGDEGKFGNREADIPDQFWARAMVRSFFASVEGFSHGARKVAVVADRVGAITLTSEEKVLLTTPEVFLADNGKPKTRERRTQTRSSLLFALDLIRRAMGTSEGLDHGGRGLKALTEALCIRDRITHPATIDDFQIEWSEVEVVSEAVTWL
jgi:hypothetical protein